MEIQLFHDEGPYHVETSLLICRVNQWTGFYMTDTVIKEFKEIPQILFECKFFYSGGVRE